jgi:hypothetical protein
MRTKHKTRRVSSCNTKKENNMNTTHDQNVTRQVLLSATEEDGITITNRDRSYASHHQRAGGRYSLIALYDLSRLAESQTEGTEGSAGVKYVIEEVAPDGHVRTRLPVDGSDHAVIGRYEAGGEYIPSVSSMRSVLPHPYWPMLTVVGSEYCGICGKEKWECFPPPTIKKEIDLVKMAAVVMCAAVQCSGTIQSSKGWSVVSYGHVSLLDGVATFTPDERVIDFFCIEYVKVAERLLSAAATLRSEFNMAVRMPWSEREIADHYTACMKEIKSKKEAAVQ